MSKGRRKGGVEGLTQREQEAMDIIYQYEPCTAILVQEHMTGDLKNATVRTILRILENKKYITHESKEKQFYYKAIISKKEAASQVFGKMLTTFFSGSITNAVATFMDEDSLNINEKELEKLSNLISQAKDKKNRNR